MKLIIVESPNKCKTIEKYLNGDYKVVATKGDIRDLSLTGEDRLGVDCENNFKPTYSVISDKKDIIKSLKSEVKKSDEIFLATDPDREGEAIAWHLSEVLKLEKDNKRLEFHEITKEAITNAIKNPRTINLNLVASQEARRIIDRIIGFRLSKVMQMNNNLKSGGRVQSATLKLIVNHEKEIASFKPEKYWCILVKVKKDDVEIKIDFFKYHDKEIKLIDEKIVKDIVDQTGKKLIVLDISKTTKSIESKPPFTTATMQQEAVTQLGMSAARVSRTAQELYEGIQVNNEHIGLVTYIRTDSTNLSNSYVMQTREYINKMYGPQYVKNVNDKQKHNKQQKDNEFAQNAHEAIRPTDNYQTPEKIRQYLTNDQYRLYKLIYYRTLAFLMANKVEEHINVVFGSENHNVLYKKVGIKTIFDGYEKLTGNVSDKTLGIDVHVNDVIDISNLEVKQDFTKPPAHYTEASIIKLMEKNGIGRPSTYSSTISILLRRLYVMKDKQFIIPTSDGNRAVEYLENKFSDIVDVNFTAKLENDLDKVEDDVINRTKVINEIYIPFMEKWNKVIQEEIGKCPECGSPLKRSYGRHGYFIGCSNYPKCNYIKKEKKLFSLLDEKCPECNSPLVKRINRMGRVFIGCSNYPKCNYIKKEKKKVTQ